MPGTTFSTANWTGYDEATVSNPSAQLDNFSLVVDIPVASLSTDWKNEVQSDGGDIRVTKGDDTELPYDLIGWSHTPGTPPTITGIIRLKWSGALSASGAQKVRIYAGYTGGTAVAYDANDVSGYGSDNAYDADWYIYWPLDDLTGGLSDRTSNGYDASYNGTPIEITGQVGGGIQCQAASSEYLVNTSLSGISDFPVTLMGWVRPESTSSECVIVAGQSSSPSEMLGVRTVSGNAELFLYTGTGAYNALTGSAVSNGSWHHVAGVFASETSRLVYTNGGNVQSEADSDGFPAAVNFISVSGWRDSSPTQGDGKHDDVQVHTAARSPAWIAHEYDQTSANATFWGTWSWTAVGGGAFGGASNVIGSGIFA